MGSRTPPDDCPGNGSDDDSADMPTPSSNHAQTRSSLRRIAGALRVPLGDLYGQSGVADPVSEPGGPAAGDAGLAAECAALIRAFARIADPAERRRILALVQASADRT